jgi:hypothetical protein
MYQFGFENKKQSNYFEGWYFRYTDTINYAIIFAITKNEKDPHAFLQVFNETMQKCIYKKYDLSLFSYTNDTVHIGNNHLSLNSVYINVDDFTLDLSLNDNTLLKNSAMGYLSKAPLDCFQEIVLLEGRAQGYINKTNTKGKTYIEKTYGNKFPKKWIWLQSNHSKNNSQISFSMGYIPFLFTLQKGWLLVIKFQDKTLQFHSLKGATLQYNDRQIIVTSLSYKVVIDYKQNSCIELVGPIEKAQMIGTVLESLTSSASIKIYKNKSLIFEDSYTNVGLEYMM